MDSTKLNILISSLRKGERSAYQEIYNEFFGVMYHLSLQYLHDKEAAHEIVQDTFLKLWEIRETLNEHFNIRNFLYTITKNCCLNYLRNLKIAHSHQQNIKYLETQYNYMALEELDNWFEFDELSERIDHAILLLPEDLRETFLLSRYDELHYKEIAEKQSVSVKTVEVRISKALRILRHELKDYLAIGWLIISGLS